MDVIPEPYESLLSEAGYLEPVLFILATMAILGGIWKGLKTFFPRVRQFIAFIDALARLPQFMAETIKMLSEHGEAILEVRHEVLPNSGGSLRDESVTNGLRIEKMEAKMSRDFERLGHIERELQYREARGIGIPSPRSEQADDVEPVGDPKPYPTLDET